MAVGNFLMPVGSSNGSNDHRRHYTIIDDGGEWTYARPGVSILLRVNGRTVTVRLRWFFWFALACGWVGGLLLL